MMIGILIRVDDFIMEGLDALCKFLWRYLQIEKIWVARAAILMYFTATTVDMFLNNPPKTSLGVTMSVFVLALGLIIFGFIHLKIELLARLPKKTQNKLVLLKRIMFAWFLFRAICLFMLISFFLIPEILLWDAFSPLSIAGWLGWYFMNVADAVFVSEEPPKKWKKIELPKLSFNLANPVPQPT